MDFVFKVYTHFLTLSFCPVFWDYISLFDDKFRFEKISKLKNLLEKLNLYIKWEDFLSIIDQTFRKTKPLLGGRPPFDQVMMFKVLVLQKIYKLSDNKT